MSTFITGLDLGQTTDPTALAVLEKTGEGPAAAYTVFKLERCPLGTPYPQIVQSVVALFGKAPLAGSILVIDQTGVGRPVVDMFRQIPCEPWGGFYPITITGGQKATWEENGDWHVPKKDLVGAAMVLFQNHRLLIGNKHRDGPTLVKEMRNFRHKITLAGNETMEAWREGQHDDLVFALSLAAWIGETTCTGPWDTTPDPRNRSVVSQAPPGVFGDWSGRWGEHEWGEHEWDDNDPRREDG